MAPSQSLMPVMAGYRFPPVIRTPSSPYCQRWHRGGWHSWKHVSEGGFDRRRFRVAEVNEGIAKRFIAERHFLGTFPAARMSFGLLTDDDALASGLEVDGYALVGVAVLSVPMRADVLTRVFPDLEPYVQSVELGRLCLTDGVAPNGESWLLGQVWRQAAAQGVRGVVSFADPFPRSRIVTGTDPDGRVMERVETVSPGHVGIAYQGAGAVACGRSTARTLLYLPRHGAVLPERTLSKVRREESGHEAAERLLVRYGATPRTWGQAGQQWLHEALNAVGAVRVRHPGNFRYAWPIGTRAQRRRVHINLPATRYPKQATDLIAGAPVRPLDGW